MNRQIREGGGVVKNSVTKILRVHDGVKGPKTLLLPLLGALMIFLSGLLSPAGATESPTMAPSAEVPPGMVLRWMNGFYMAIPEDWKAVTDRGGVGFYTGVHPDAMKDPSLAELPMAALMVTRDRPPRGGDYSAFFAEIEAMGKDETTNFTSFREDTFIGSHPAVFYSFSAEMKGGGSKNKIEGRMIVSKIPDTEGMHTLITLAMTESSMEKYGDVIKAILASAQDGPPPLEKTLSYPIKDIQEVFRHYKGPFTAPDGTVAILDKTKGRIRLYDPAGAVLGEWGVTGKGEDGSLDWPSAVAFASDGSLYVAENGFYGGPNIQRFSREGGFLGRIWIGKKALGEGGIYEPKFLAVAGEGKIVVKGSAVAEGVADRVLVFSPEGELLASWEIGPVKTLALLKDDRLVATREGKDNADTFHIFDLTGKELMEWPFYGVGLPPTPGDEEVYFRPEYLGADGEGRIYAYDDSDDGIWIYGEDGRFLHTVDARRTFNIVEGMTVLPNGDVIIRDRPRGYEPGDPSIHRMKNAFPAALPKEEAEASVTIVGGETPSMAEGAPAAPAEGLEAELTRLKKALELREGAAKSEEKGDFAEAAAKYRESLKYYEDPAVAPYAEGLDRRSAAMAATLKGETKEEERSDSPIAKPVELQEKQSETVKELPAPKPDPAKEARKKAEALWQEGAASQQAKKYEEALELYRQGLKLSDEASVRDHVAKLEAFIPKAKARAEALWNEAGKLQVAKKYDEALKKYKEGLDIYHNAVVVEHAAKLEAFIAKQKK